MKTLLLAPSAGGRRLTRPERHIIRVAQRLECILADRLHRIGRDRMAEPLSSILAIAGYKLTRSAPYGPKTSRASIESALRLLKAQPHWKIRFHAPKLISVDDVDWITLHLFNDPLWVTYRLLRPLPACSSPLSRVLAELHRQGKDRVTVSRLIVLLGARVRRGTAGTPRQRKDILDGLDRLHSRGEWVIQCEPRDNANGGDQTYVHFLPGPKLCQQAEKTEKVTP